ncbi:MAG: TetR/AcrR family transcriptional regulator [Myxococcota bacterium]
MEPTMQQTKQTSQPSPSHRRKRVIETAQRLIGKTGYHGVTMRDLARESGVSIPTLYKLFGDKKHLLDAAVGAGMSEMILGRCESRGVRRYLALLEGLACSIGCRPDYIGSLVQSLHDHWHSWERFAPLASKLLAELEAALREMREAGELVDWADPGALADRVAGYCVSTLMAWHGGHIEESRVAPTLVYGGASMVMGFSLGGSSAVLANEVRQRQPFVQRFPRSNRST